MLQWFRTRASRIAIVASVSLAALGLSALSPHVDDCHDAACGAALVEHDAGAHVVTAPVEADGDHPLHCLVCHWTRSFRPPISVAFVATPAVEAGLRVFLDLTPVARRIQVAQPPLRSPPASPALA